MNFGSIKWYPLFPLSCQGEAYSHEFRSPWSSRSHQLLCIVELIESTISHQTIFFQSFFWKPYLLCEYKTSAAFCLCRLYFSLYSCLWMSLNWTPRCLKKRKKDYYIRELSKKKAISVSTCLPHFDLSTGNN